MSRPSNKIIFSNKSITASHRKCAHHVYSYAYAKNMKMHDEIVNSASNTIVNTSFDPTLNIKIAMHFLAPVGTYDQSRVVSRAHDIIMSVNDDFNNYSGNSNTMNNYRYKSIVNQVFVANQPKQEIYLGRTYTDVIPTEPSNISFSLGNVYYYPIKSSLNLAQYNDVTQVEMQTEAIKQFIHTNRADAIDPAHFLNIWVIDMTNTSILGFSNFPWETLDNYHGVVINRKVFFPEDYPDSPFNNYKTVTHEIGHYLGLLHVFSNDNNLGAYAAVNLNSDINDTTGDYIADTPAQLNPTYDPTDTVLNKQLLTDPDYNPLFMNFMDYTYDKYVGMFTRNQLQKMRYMITTYRTELGSVNATLPEPKYKPASNTMVESITKSDNFFRSTQNQNPATTPSNLAARADLLRQTSFITNQKIIQPIIKSNPAVKLDTKKRFTRKRPTMMISE